MTRRDTTDRGGRDSSVWSARVLTTVCVFSSLLLLLPARVHVSVSLLAAHVKLDLPKQKAVGSAGASGTLR